VKDPKVNWWCCHQNPRQCKSCLNEENDDVVSVSTIDDVILPKLRLFVVEARICYHLDRKIVPAKKTMGIEVHNVICVAIPNDDNFFKNCHWIKYSSGVKDYFAKGGGLQGKFEILKFYLKFLYDLVEEDDIVYPACYNIIPP